MTEKKRLKTLRRHKEYVRKRNEKRNKAKPKHVLKIVQE